MEIAKVSISGVTAQTVSASPIPVGIIGATVTLEFNDPVWDGLTKNVVFVGTKDVEILDVQGSVVLPAEAITAHNILVRMGVCGIAADGSMAIPTLWADLGVTIPATPVNLATNPQLPVWAQLQNMIGSLRDLETEAKDNLVDAVNEAAKSSNVDLSGYVKSINGVAPDPETGDVAVEIPEYTLPVAGDELGGVKNGGNVVINADGTMTAPGSVQPDLSQNDPTQPDYVKNRTHWEESTGATIEWDGNTDGRDIVALPNANFYKVSDLTPAKDDLVGSEIVVRGSTMETTEDVLLDGDNCTMNGYGVIVVYDTSFTIQGLSLTANSCGVYFIGGESGSVTKLTYGSTTVHPLDEKFIPDTIARTADIPDAIPMPPTASAGQFIVVTSVDENGKVTAVKAIENPVTDEHINALIDAKLAEIEVLPNAEEVAF